MTLRICVQVLLVRHLAKSHDFDARTLGVCSYKISAPMYTVAFRVSACRSLPVLGAAASPSGSALELVNLSNRVVEVVVQIQQFLVKLVELLGAPLIGTGATFQLVDNLPS